MVARDTERGVSLKANERTSLLTATGAKPYLRWTGPASILPSAPAAAPQKMVFHVS